MNESNPQAIRTAAIALLLATGVACSDPKTPEQYVQDARQYLQQGESATAIIELKNAIQSKPDNIEARLLLGGVYLDQGELLSAEKELQRAQKLGAAPSQVMLPLARVQLQLGKFGESVDLLQSLHDLSAGDQVIAHVIRGQAMLALGQNAEAEAEFNMANEINEGHSYSQFGQALLASSSEDFEKSRNLIEGVLKESPNMLEALSLYGNLSFANGDYPQAIDAFRRYLQQRPTAGHVSLLLANSLLENEQYDDAEHIIKQLLAVNESHAFANFLGAKIALRKEQFLPALDYAERSLSRVGNNLPAKLIAGISAYRLGRIEQAYNHLAAIRERLPADHMGRKILAVLKLKLGYAEDASTDFSDLQLAQTNDAKLLVAASLEFAQAGNVDSATQMIEKAAALQPDNARLKAQEGLLKLAMDDPSGLQILEDAVDAMPENKDAELYLAMNYLKSGQVAKAQEIADKWQQLEPDKAEGWLMQGMIEGRARQYTKAEAAFNKVLSLFPNHAGARLNLSLLAEKQEDMPGAIRQVEQILTEAPDNQLAIMRRAALLGKQSGDPAQTIAALEQGVKTLPDSMTLKLALSHAYREGGRLKEGIALLSAVDTEARQPSEFWLQYGDLLVRDRQYPRALEVFEQWSAQHPNKPQAVLRQLATLELLGRPKDALQLIESVSTRFNELPELQLMRASFLMLNNNLEDCRSLLDKLKRRHGPAMAKAFYGLEGELFYREGDTKAALPLLQKAYDNTKKPRYIKLLAASYLRLEDSAKASAVLRDHLAQYADDNSSRVMLAGLYTQLDPAKSIEQYRILNRSFPNNPMFLNNLAWQLVQQEQAEEAEQHARKALAQAPDNANILDTYGVILQKLQRQDQAFEMFQKAQSLSPENAAIALHLAEALLSRGQPAKARRVLNGVANPTPKQQQEILRLRKLANNS